MISFLLGQKSLPYWNFTARVCVARVCSIPHLGIVYGDYSKSRIFDWVGKYVRLSSLLIDHRFECCKWCFWSRHRSQNQEIDWSWVGFRAKLKTNSFSGLTLVSLLQLCMTVVYVISFFLQYVGIWASNRLKQLLFWFLLFFPEYSVSCRY